MTATAGKRLRAVIQNPFFARCLFHAHQYGTARRGLEPARTAFAAASLKSRAAGS
jgi:hypothetical protein